MPLRQPDVRPFPMQNGPPIPWFVAQAIYTHLYRFSGQTLDRLAERGGFSWAEVDYLWGKRKSRDGAGPHPTTDAQRAACRAEVAAGFDALAGEIAA